ncbi:MAG: hypothetical protein ACK2UB_03705 [Anaerolineales bacterium]
MTRLIQQFLGGFRFRFQQFICTRRRFHFGMLFGFYLFQGLPGFRIPWIDSQYLAVAVRLLLGILQRIGEEHPTGFLLGIRTDHVEQQSPGLHDLAGDEEFHCLLQDGCEISCHRR